MALPTLERPSRESVTTIRSDGSRPFLYPTDSRGRFTQARRYSALALIGVYLLLPWIRINGYPAVFLDVAERRFHLFGVTFAAQDMWLLFFLITGVGFTLFFVTALFGRVWCGWACPQTVFLDHVYRRIERWIEGDSLKRRALAAAPWNARKIWLRTAKHGLYLLVSWCIMHLFLAYFVSIPEVWAMLRASPTEHWGAFAFMAISTAVLYFNFGWFREQLCIVLCPYGRLQSALVDENTLAIGYDARRGEPRRGLGIPLRGDVGGETSARTATSPTGAKSARAPNAANGGLSKVAEFVSRLEGDCIDCARCVNVCPTGIDIRQGLQMECIGCTACVDVCDDVMTRLGRPRGLIRYDSQAGFAQRRTRWVRSRTILYFVLFVIGLAVSGWAISTIKPATLGVTRMTGAPYIVDATSVRNQFLVRIVNKRNTTARFTVAVERAPADVRQLGFDGAIELGPLAEVVRPLVVQDPRATYTGPFRFKVRVRDTSGAVNLDRDLEFVGPEARLLKEDAEAKP